MKIEVKVSELVKKLQRTNDVINSKPAMPILGFVKVDVVSQDRATLTGNDLGGSISQDLAINLVSDDYEPVLLNVSKLLAITNLLPGDTVLTIAVDGANPLKLTTTTKPRIKQSLPFLAATDFRVLDAQPESKTKLNNGMMRRLLERVESSAPSKEQKHAVASVLLEGDGKQLQAVATDGFRIAIGVAPDGTSGDAFSIQLPKSMLAILKNISGEFIDFSASETNFFFKTATELVVLSKPTTKFPDWRRALTLKDWKTTAVVAASELKTAVALASITSDAKRPSVIVVTDEASMAILSNSSEGDSNIEVEGTIGGEVLANKVRLNQAFITDFLANVDGQVTMSMKDARSFVKLTSESNFIYLIMPLLMEAPKTEPTAETKAS